MQTFPGEFVYQKDRLRELKSLISDSIYLEFEIGHFHQKLSKTERFTMKNGVEI